MSAFGRWRGTRAVVTGAGSGIGRATAMVLAARGLEVVAVDIDDASAKATAAACGGAAYPTDVADAEAMDRLAREVVADHGVPDLVVNNAGVGMSGRFLDTTEDDWRWIVGTNLLGVVHGCRAFGPYLLEQRAGHVVNVSSGLGFWPRATEPAYVTTKAGVLALSRCLRADWGPSGVGVSVVCPGIVDTAILERTRFRGAQGAEQRVARLARVFSRGHPPELVAAGVIAAVERNRPVVPVGVDAWAGWIGHRLLPSRLIDRSGRMTIAGI